MASRSSPSGALIDEPREILNWSQQTAPGDFATLLAASELSSELLVRGTKNRHTAMQTRLDGPLRQAAAADLANVAAQSASDTQRPQWRASYSASAARGWPDGGSAPVSRAANGRIVGRPAAHEVELVCLCVCVCYH